MEDHIKRIFEYYDVGRISMAGEGNCVRVDLYSAPCLRTDARISFLDEKTAHGLRWPRSIDRAEELSHVQKILFRALEKSFEANDFQHYVAEPYVILSPMADMYKAMLGSMGRIRQYAGRISCRKLKLIDRDIPAPAFTADMDSDMLSMRIAKRLDIANIEAYVMPFVGHEECAFFIANFADRISRGGN